MPTLTYTAVFTSNLETSGPGAGWTWSSAGGTFTSSDGSPNAGCLEVLATGKSGSHIAQWVYTSADTWENIFGVPPNSTITKVGGGTSDGYVWRCSKFVGPISSGFTGPFQLLGSDRVTITGTFSSAIQFTSTTNWSTVVAANAINLNTASNNLIAFGLNAKVNSGSSSTANLVALHQDTIQLTVTYTTAAGSFSMGHRLLCCGVGA